MRGEVTGLKEEKPVKYRQSHHSSDNRDHYKPSRREATEHTERSDMSQIPDGRRVLTHYRPRYQSENNLQQASSNSRFFNSQR